MNPKRAEFKIRYEIYRLLKILAAVVCAVVIFGTLLNVEASAKNVQVGITVQYGQTEARSILKMINSFRKSSDAWYWNESDSKKVVCKGLPELKYDTGLEKAAMLRAAEIAFSYGHTRPSEEPCFTVFSECGIVYTWAGENIAAGYDTASEVHQAWREDDESYAGQGHRRIMLSDKYNAVGIAHVYYNGYHYWAESFGCVKKPKPNGTAKNGISNVTIKVNDARIKALSVNFTENLQYLKIGSESAISSVKLRVDEQWPEMLDRPVNMMPTLVPSSTSVAIVSGSKITGRTEGSTTVTASLLGRNCSVSLKIHDCMNHGTLGSSCQVCGAVVKEPPIVSLPTQKTVNEQESKAIETAKQTTAAPTKQKVKVPTKQKATIKLSKTTATLKKGKSVTIKVSNLAKGDSVQFWKTSNKKVAVVSKGKITAKGKGKAVITVALKSGKTATVKVIVK